MENVWNIRKNENLYYILAENYSKNVVTNKVFLKTAIIVYLYYDDGVEDYFKYIDSIPSGINIYIISSNLNTLKIINRYAHNKEYISVIGKENRGRDISALLVVSRDIFFKYEYVCFIHDKKMKEYNDVKDFELWVRNLWDNTLKNGGYIRNVIDILMCNEKIGLLVPPEPIGNQISTWYVNAWYNEYDMTVRLADRLKLDADLNPHYSPITLGTVFWCKTDALKKLFDINWDYCDFQDEPLPNEGTLNHAVERIFAYVAQDAGYKTGTIMTASYASKLLSDIQDKMRNTYDFLCTQMGICDYRGIAVYKKCEKVFQEFADRNKDIYIYGAGLIGKRCINMLNNIGIFPKAVIVSIKGENEQIANIPIVSFDSLGEKKDIGIIIAVGEKNNEEIKGILKDGRFYNYISYSDIWNS